MKFKLPFMSPASALEEAQERDYRATLRILPGPVKVASVGALASPLWEVWEGNRMLKGGFESKTEAQHWIEQREYV
jgi:hypothetical protein